MDGTQAEGNTTAEIADARLLTAWLGDAGGRTIPLSDGRWKVHAVVVKLTIEGEPEVAEQGLRHAIPRASSAPGFIAGYWTHSEDGSNGLSMILFDSEESARRAAEMIQAPDWVRPETVTLESVEVREVVGNA